MAVRCLIALAAAGLAVLLAAPAAPAKDGVRARLLESVDLDVPPGERIPVSWALEDERGRPFGAGGVFVRLRSATGEESETAVTEGAGRFRAMVTVPAGGIGAIEFGLQGWRTAGGRTTRADMRFPLENDPLATTAPAAKGDRFPPWLPLLIGVGAIGALGAIGGVGRRMRGQPNDGSTGPSTSR